MTSQQSAPAPAVRTYVAESYEAAIRDFEADARVMAEHGYQPASQTWVPDEAGRGCFWIAIIVILFVTIIGIVLLPFVMKDRKKGTLTVTYTYAAITSPVQQEVRTTATQPVAAPAPPATSPERPTKICPDCAETILEAARICRFCRHEFWMVDAPPPVAPETMMGREEMVPAQEPPPELQVPLVEPEAPPPGPRPAPPWGPSPPQQESEAQAHQPPPPPYAPQQPPPSTPPQPTYPPPPPTWQPPAQGQPPQGQPPQGQPPQGQPPGQGPGAWGPPPRPPDRPGS